MLDKLNQEEFKRSGLSAVKFEPSCSSDFIFVCFVSESLKNGRNVVYVSASRKAESFRIASNKMSVRLDAQRFHFIEVGSMLGPNIEETGRSKLLEKVDNALGQHRNALVVLDNIHLLAAGELTDEISLLVDIQKLVDPASSLVVFGTCREINVLGYRNDLDTLPELSSFHYYVGERSIQMLFPGTGSVL